jgi:hypothetical protein
VTRDDASAGADVYAPPAGRVEDAAGPRQTRLGQASLFIAVTIGFLQLAALATTMFAAWIDPTHPRVAGTSPLMIVAFVILLGGVGVQAVGLLLGIAGTLRRSRLRKHAWIGLALNSIPIVVLASLMIYGATRH